MTPYVRAWYMGSYTEYIMSYDGICQGVRIPDGAAAAAAAAAAAKAAKICAMHDIKTLPCKNLPERECKMQQNGSHSETI